MKQPNLKVQTRDEKIMQFAFKHRAVTYGQIRQKFFPIQHESASRNRIYALCKAGYLKSLSMVKNGIQVKYVVPLERCWEKIENAWSFPVTNPLYKSESIAHDIGLVDIILKFERLRIFDAFFSENLLQSSPDLRIEDFVGDAALLYPDGILKLKLQDGTYLVYAVEYEVSKKAKDRYRQKLDSYYKAGGIDGVLYVCGDQEILDVIARLDKEVRNGSPSRVFSAIESNVLKSKGLIEFHASDGEAIGLY